MRKEIRLRATGIILPTIIFIVWLFLIDYSDFFSRKNMGAFLGMIAMIGVVVGSVILNKQNRSHSCAVIEPNQNESQNPL